MSDRKPRWRMTFQELCYRARVTPTEIERWASSGALGPRLQESTEGRWRHVTKDMAERALLTRLLLDQGLTLESVAGMTGKEKTVARHEHGLDLTIDNMTIRVGDPNALDVEEGGEG